MDTSSNLSLAMDPIPTPVAAVGLCICITTLLYFVKIMWRKPGSTKGTAVPEASGAWPIIGHLHLLGGKELPHKVLAALADKHGPIFMIRIGVHRALVVSSWEVAKECYTINDETFSSRPGSTSSEILGYKYAMFGVAPYGSYWREFRKIMMSELFSSRRLGLLKHITDSEIKASIKELYILHHGKKSSGPVLVEMKEWFGDLTLNVILRMTVGQRYSGDEESEVRKCHKAMRDFMRLAGTFIVDDAVPYLKWLDLQGYKKEMKETSKQLDCLFQGWLEEKQRKKLSGEAKEEQDFMDVLMTKLEHTKISEFDNDTVIKAACVALITGGNDTTMLTLTWILSLLLNNRQALKKAQEELDNHVGRDRHVEESDIKNLVYLKAIFKEAMRVCPPSPLTGARLATKDCTVAGYHVPAGTRLVVNAWKIQRDPLVWSDPSEFHPERFLTDHVEMDVKGQHFELIPFGAGRRTCPGMAFALQVMPLVMATLLHAFEITTPRDMLVDMSETPGLTNVKATPLEVIITPRLGPELYGDGL